jgi:hypothetical protein
MLSHNFFSRGLLQWLALLLASLLVGCEPPVPNPRKVVLTNNAEQAPTGAPAGVFSSEHAHSWQQSIKVGQEAEYWTLGVSTWAAMGKPRHLRMQLWTWLPDARHRGVELVAKAQRPNAVAGGPAAELGIYYFSLAEVVRRYQQWAPTTFSVSLPRDLLPTDEISFFMWVPTDQGGAVYIDDFTVENLD